MHAVTYISIIDLDAKRNREAGTPTTTFLIVIARGKDRMTDIRTYNFMHGKHCRGLQAYLCKQNKLKPPPAGIFL